MLLPPFSPAWQFSTDSIAEASTATNALSCTPGGSNADGTAITLLGALAQDVEFLVLDVVAGGAWSAANNNAILGDILIDPAGGTSWSSLVDDMCLGGPGSAGTPSHYCVRHCFPLWVKSGASIGFRARAARVSPGTLRVVATAFGKPRNPQAWWCGTKVETLGSTAASSKGTDVVPGASNAYGSWTTIGTSGPRYGAIALSHQLPATSTVNSDTMYFEAGINSAQIPGTPQWRGGISSNENGSRSGMELPWFVDVPGGSTVQARASSSVVSPQTPTVCIHGVY